MRDDSPAAQPSPRIRIVRPPIRPYRRGVHDAREPTSAQLHDPNGAAALVVRSVRRPREAVRIVADRPPARYPCRSDGWSSGCRGGTGRCIAAQGESAGSWCRWRSTHCRTKARAAQVVAAARESCARLRSTRWPRGSGYPHRQVRVHAWSMAFAVVVSAVAVSCEPCPWVSALGDGAVDQKRLWIGMQLRLPSSPAERISALRLLRLNSRLRTVVNTGHHNSTAASDTIIWEPDRPSKCKDGALFRSYQRGPRSLPVSTLHASGRVKSVYATSHRAVSRSAESSLPCT